MTFEQKWIEYDYNPFILFAADGKVVSLNAEAQFLLGSVSPRIIYNLATTYASSSFGFNTTFLDLEYGQYRFFGITVGYEDEERIGIRLYQKPSHKFSKPKEEGKPVNIYSIVDLCISSNSIGSNIRFSKDFDPTLPEIRLHADAFIKMINKIIEAMSQTEFMKFRIYYRIGEYVKYENIKYSLFSLEIASQRFDKKYIGEIELLAEENNLYIDFKEDRINIEIQVAAPTP